eukprot:EG_transcript_11356
MQLLLESSGRGKASRPHTPETRRLLQLILALSSLGIILSVYLLYGHYAGFRSTLCEFGKRLSCRALARRGLASLHGIPVAFLGVEWFAVMLLVGWVALPEQQPLLHAMLVAWNAVGLVLVLCLVLVEVVAGVLCPFCTAVHATVLGTAYFSLRLWRRTDPAPTLRVLWQHLVAYPQVVGSFLVLNAFVVGLFNLHSEASQGPDWWDQRAQTQLVDCLRLRDVTLWSLGWCRHCKRQKGLLRRSTSELLVVDCAVATERPRCKAKNITAYPTWTMGEQRRYGIIDLDELDKWADCRVVHRPKGR